MHRAGTHLKTGGWVLPAVHLGFFWGEASERFCVPVPWLLETLRSIFCVRREQMGAFPPSAPEAEKGMYLENCSMSAKKRLNCICKDTAKRYLRSSSGCTAAAVANRMEFSRIGCSGDLVADTDWSGQVDSMELPACPLTQHLQMLDQTIFLITFPAEGVAHHRNSCSHFAFLTGRLFDGGIRLLFFQGMGSKWRCQVNAAGLFFPSIFHRAPVQAHQFLISSLVSLPCCLSAFLAPPCSPRWVWRLFIASQILQGPLPGGTWDQPFGWSRKPGGKICTSPAEQSEAVFQP